MSKQFKDLTEPQRRLMEDLRDLGGVFSVFSSWEWQILRRLREAGYVRKRDDGAYDLTAEGRYVIS